MKASLKIYITTLSILGIFSIIYLWEINPIQANTLDILLFIFLILLSHNASVFILRSTKTQTSIKLPIVLPGFLIIGPFWITIVTSLFSINFKQIKDRFALRKFIFNRVNLILSVTFSIIIFNYIQQNIIDLIFINFLFAALAYFFVNNLLLYFVLKISDDGDPRTVITYISHLSKNVFVSYFLAIITYQGYQYFGTIFLPLALIIIYIMKDLFYSRLQQMNLSTQVVESFLKVIDAKDNYTQGHCERVAKYTAKLCKACGFANTKTETIVNMAKIHDIGKIYIDEETLKSTDSLSDEQYRKMQQHSQFGYDLLQDIDLFEEDLEIIKYHHERFDGLGYPEGQEGEDIPKGARILSICDAFDVMTTGRDYKPPMSKNQVIQEMKECAGKQFDPEYTREMIKLIEDNHFDDRFSTTEPSHQEIESTRSRQIPLQQSLS